MSNFLIIESDLKARKVMEDILLSMGHTFESVDSEIDGVVLMIEKEFDFVFLCFGPTLNSCDTVEDLHRENGLSKIIVFFEEDDYEYREKGVECENLGAVDTIQKPLHPDDIRRLITMHAEPEVSDEDPEEKNVVYLLCRDAMAKRSVKDFFHMEKDRMILRTFSKADELLGNLQRSIKKYWDHIPIVMIDFDIPNFNFMEFMDNLDSLDTHSAVAKIFISDKEIESSDKIDGGSGSTHYLLKTFSKLDIYKCLSACFDYHSSRLNIKSEFIKYNDPESKILVYDNHEADLKLLQDKLFVSNVATYHIKRANDVIRELRSGKYKAFLVGMHSKDAYLLDMIKDIRSDPTLKNVITVVLVDNPSQVFVEKMVLLGIYSYLKKPVDFFKLSTILKKLLLKTANKVSKRQHVRITPDPKDNVRAALIVKETLDKHQIISKVLNLSYGGFVVQTEIDHSEIEYFKNNDVLVGIAFPNGQVKGMSKLVNVKGNFWAFQFVEIQEEDKTILVQYIHRHQEHQH